MPALLLPALLLGAAVLAPGVVPADAPPAHAAETDGRSYVFGTSEKHTNVAFTSEADVENIYGMTHVVSGRAWLDLKDGEGKCNLRIPVKDLRTGIDLRDEHLRSETWLDAAKYPDITLTSDGFTLKLKNETKRIHEAAFRGKLTIHGVTRDLSTTATVTEVPEKAAKLLGEGRWVRVVATFEAKLSEFGVTIPDGPVQGKVNDTWTVKFDCYANAKEE